MSNDEKFTELAAARVLLVDDDETTTDLISSMLCDSVASIDVRRTCADAITSARAGSHTVALVDVNLPDGNGFDVISRFKTEKIPLSVIMITGLVDPEMAHLLEQSGVQTLLTKPFSQTQLKFSICRELARKRQRGRERAVLISGDAPGNELVGISPYIRELRRKIEDFSASDIPLLIMGPTGTGKEIVARAIHSRSVRAKKPLITVNSSAIPEHLEESEFFGYAKGAFTGASQAKEGILKCADGATLFLDEVGELSLRMQAKLLRVLDGHEFMRLGDTAPQRSDFRLVSATNRPLSDMIKAGLFREDLYFRLRAASIVTSPLSKHKEDIPALINHFLSKQRQNTGREFSISIEALDVITHYTWPGNIRELKNTIESLCSMSQESDVISKESVLWVLSEAAKGDTAPVVPFSAAKMDFERDYYRNLLIKFNGNISMASRAAGIERAYFSKRIRALGLAKEKFVANNNSGKKE
jgi:two-component system nitrogen regulation response regulator NtrX